MLYYTHVVLSTEEWLDLDWWEVALWLNVGVQAYSQNQGTIGISFSDGSSSGTGRTMQVIRQNGPCPMLEAWVGMWQPIVHSFSSGWQELHALVHTLKQELGGMG